MQSFDKLSFDTASEDLADIIYGCMRILCEIEDVDEALASAIVAGWTPFGIYMNKELYEHVVPRSYTSESAPPVYIEFYIAAMTWLKKLRLDQQLHSGRELDKLTWSACHWRESGCLLKLKKKARVKVKKEDEQENEEEKGQEERKGQFGLTAASSSASDDDHNSGDESSRESSVLSSDDADAIDSQTANQQGVHGDVEDSNINQHGGAQHGDTGPNISNPAQSEATTADGAPTPDQQAQTLAQRHDQTSLNLESNEGCDAEAGNGESLLTVKVLYEKPNSEGGSRKRKRDQQITVEAIEEPAEASGAPTEGERMSKTITVRSSWDSGGRPHKILLSFNV